MRIMHAFVLAITVALAAPTTAIAQETPAYVTHDAMIAAGDVSLSTRLYAPPDRATYPAVLLIPGAGLEGVRDSVYMRILAQAFTARGIAALAYDKRGTGASTGAYTGGDFEALGADAAALVRHLQAQPQIESVGLWGVSQAGWVAPYAVRETSDLAFAIIVSAPGVNPYEQVSHFLHLQALSWGLNEEEAAAADRMHRAVALYYSGRASYRSAQREVDRHRGARWFQGVITHPYWDEMSAEGRILTPDALAAARRDRPGAFEIYIEPSSFVDYTRDYRRMRLPTLLIYGSADALVPVERSRALFERVFRGDRRHRHDVVVYDGADHDIQTPEGRVRSDYLDAMTLWASERFAER